MEITKEGSNGSICFEFNLYRHLEGSLSLVDKGTLEHFGRHLSPYSMIFESPQEMGLVFWRFPLFACGGVTQGHLGIKVDDV